MLRLRLDLTPQSAMSPLLLYVQFGFIAGALAAMAVPFVLLVSLRFRQITSQYSTISAYCSAPGRFGNRFMLALTCILGCTLASLYAQEYASDAHTLRDDGRFWARLVSVMLLPLVGICYTTGVGASANQYYDLGFVQLPIAYSDYTHSAVALLYMGVHTATTTWYTVEFLVDSQRPHHVAVPLLAVALLSDLVLAVFIALQAALRLLWPGAPPTSPSPTTRRDIVQGASFVTELAALLTISALAALVSLARNNSVPWFKA